MMAELMANQIIQVHIADIHFGCVDPYEELNILTKQFIEPISRISFHILAIDGDLFDRRFSANHPAISCAIEFVNRCAMLCKMRNAALILLYGTESHDAGQLSIFNDLKNTVGCEVYIIDHISFVYTHGLKILCIPEEYGKGKQYYEEFLKQTYDTVFMHGTLVGGIPGATKEDLDARREPIFSIDSFSGCKGPIISGHVHTAMCLQQHMYYLSSPIRWRFGEEQEKGYAIVILDKSTYRYMYQFQPIQSYKYVTIDVSTLSTKDPNEIIQVLQNMQISEHIDWIRLNCNGLLPYQIEILSKYIRENKNSNIKLLNANAGMSSNGEIIATQPTQDQIDALDKMKFLLDDKLDDMVKFVMFLNMNEGSSYITVDLLKKILSND